MAANTVGLTNLLQRLPHRDCLIVLNYHRIGSPSTTEYDPGLFSATSETFDRQLSFLDRYFHVITLEEALTFVVSGRSSSRSTKILITFDDGYKDVYDYAFPILRQHRLQATFFLCTTFVGSHRLPWWDRIAYMLRNTNKTVLRLSRPEEMQFDLQSEGYLRALRTVLALYKAMPSEHTPSFLNELTESTGVFETEATDRHFLNWDEARKMVSAGMAVGSHTHTHGLLGRQSPEQQEMEVQESRRILEGQLGIIIDTMAYPVGGRFHFTEATKTALNRANYRGAFSFYGGVNLPRQTTPYDICRVSVENDESFPLFRLRTASAAVAGRTII